MYESHNERVNFLQVHMNRNGNLGKFRKLLFILLNIRTYKFSYEYNVQTLELH